MRTEHDIRKIYEAVVLNSTVASPYGFNETALITNQNPQASHTDAKIDVSSQLSHSIDKRLSQSPQTTKRPQIWFGDLSRSGFDTNYLSEINWQMLHTGVTFSDFDKGFEVLEEAKRACGQSWANLPRLCKQFHFIEALWAAG